jgi:hypothetical protein
LLWAGEPMETESSANETASTHRREKTMAPA